MVVFFVYGRSEATEAGQFVNGVVDCVGPQHALEVGVQTKRHRMSEVNVVEF